MPEIGTPGLMSGDGKRGIGHRPQATAPILDSTDADMSIAFANSPEWLTCLTSAVRTGA